MKARVASSVFVCLVLLVGVSFAGANDYLTGKIIKVEKQPSAATSGTSDAPLTAQSATYHISIQLGNKIYVCEYKAHPEIYLNWIEGNEVQARVKGKTIYVKKLNGEEARGYILSTSPAGNR